MPQVARFRPQKPFFVQWATVKAKDFITLKMNGRVVLHGRSGVSGRLGALYGAGPKEWSPRKTEADRITHAFYVHAGNYLTLEINHVEKLQNSLSLHDGWVGVIEDRAPSGG